MICILIKMTRNTSFILILFLSPIDSARRDIFNSDQQTKSLNSPRPAVAEPIQIQKNRWIKFEKWYHSFLCFPPVGWGEFNYEENYVLVLCNAHWTS